MGWHIANGIAELLVTSGLVLLPLLMLFWRNWSEPMRSQSMRAAAAVSLRRMEIDALTAVVIIVFAFLPAVPVSRADLQFTAPYTDTPTTAQAPDLPYRDDTDARSDIRVPILWWLIYQTSSLITEQVIALVDELGDPAVLRASLLRIAQLSITDERLIGELRQFRSDCYEPSLAKYQRAAAPPVAADDYAAVDWLGSHLFIRTEGYYRRCSAVTRCGTGYQARTPVVGWPTRSGVDPAPGQPQCDVWWEHDHLGLRVRLLADLQKQSPSFRRDIQRVANRVNDERGSQPLDLVRRFEDRVLRRMLNQVPRMMVARADRESGFFFNSFGWFSADGLQQLVATIGALVLSVLMHIVMELVVVGLPMLQALMLMLLYIILPLVVPYAALQPSVIIRAALLLFALRFMTALWAIAEFLDEKLLRTLYPDASILEFGGSGTVADVVLGLITLTAYLTLPLAWLLLVGTLGSRSVQALAGSWGQWSRRFDQSAGGVTSRAASVLQVRRS